MQTSKKSGLQDTSGVFSVILLLFLIEPTFGHVDRSEDSLDFRVLLSVQEPWLQATLPNSPPPRVDQSPVEATPVPQKALEFCYFPR